MSNEIYENIKGKVTVCFSCKTIEISRYGDRSCRFCGCPNLYYWSNKKRFFTYLNNFGLKEFEVRDIKLIDEILKVFKRKEGK